MCLGLGPQTAAHRGITVTNDRCTGVSIHQRWPVRKIAAPFKIRKNEWSRSSRNVQKIRDYIICSEHRTFLFSNFLNDFVPKTFCFLNISECGRFGHRVLCSKVRRWYLKKKKKYHNNLCFHQWNIIIQLYTKANFFSLIKTPNTVYICNNHSWYIIGINLFYKLLQDKIYVECTLNKMLRNITIKALLIFIQLWSF